MKRATILTQRGFVPLSGEKWKLTFLINHAYGQLKA